MKQKRISQLLGIALLALLLRGATPAAAQSPAQAHSTEWAITTGWAADLPGGAKGGEFWAMQLRWGKVLTAPHGPGALRGTLEYAFEIVPAMVLRKTSIGIAGGGLTTPTPGDPFGVTTTASRISDGGGVTYGGGFNPFFWQYNFTSAPQQHLVPYLQLGAGMLFTSREFPAGTSSFNFTPQGGIGAYWFAKPDRAISFGVRYHHISNAGITKPNPGHNALYFYGGLSWWR